MTENNKKTLESIIQKFGADGCEYVLENDELPAIKLTAQEMEFIKGGISWEEFKASVKASWDTLTNNPGLFVT